MPATLEPGSPPQGSSTHHRAGPAGVATLRVTTRRQRHGFARGVADGRDEALRAVRRAGEPGGVLVVRPGQLHHRGDPLAPRSGDGAVHGHLRHLQPGVAHPVARRRHPPAARHQPQWLVVAHRPDPVRRFHRADRVLRHGGRPREQHVRAAGAAVPACSSTTDRRSRLRRCAPRRDRACARRGSRRPAPAAPRGSPRWSSTPARQRRAPRRRAATRGRAAGPGTSPSRCRTA